MASTRYYYYSHVSQVFVLLFFLSYFIFLLETLQYVTEYNLKVKQRSICFLYK